MNGFCNSFRLNIKQTNFAHVLHFIHIIPNNYFVQFMVTIHF